VYFIIVVYDVKYIQLDMTQVAVAFRNFELASKKS